LIANKTLTVLNLGKTSIGEEGAMSVAQMINANKKLKALHLSTLINKHRSK
jgi:hypothetical protein